MLETIILGIIELLLENRVKNKSTTSMIYSRGLNVTFCSFLNTYFDKIRIKLINFIQTLRVRNFEFTVSGKDFYQSHILFILIIIINIVCKI